MVSGELNQCKLEPGDMILYKGRELEHWRQPYQGKMHGAAFLHYVNQDGPCADSIYDLKKIPDTTPLE